MAVPATSTSASTSAHLLEQGSLNQAASISASPADNATHQVALGAIHTSTETMTSCTVSASSSSSAPSTLSLSPRSCLRGIEPEVRENMKLATTKSLNDSKQRLITKESALKTLTQQYIQQETRVNSCKQRLDNIHAAQAQASSFIALYEANRSALSTMIRFDPVTVAGTTSWLATKIQKHKDEEKTLREGAPAYQTLLTTLQKDLQQLTEHIATTKESLQDLNRKIEDLNKQLQIYADISTTDVPHSASRQESMQFIAAVVQEVKANSSKHEIETGQKGSSTQGSVHAAAITPQRAQSSSSSTSSVSRKRDPETRMADSKADAQRRKTTHEISPLFTKLYPPGTPVWYAKQKAALRACSVNNFAQGGSSALPEMSPALPLQAPLCAKPNEPQEAVIIRYENDKAVIQICGSNEELHVSLRQCNFRPEIGKRYLLKDPSQNAYFWATVHDVTFTENKNNAWNSGIKITFRWTNFAKEGDKPLFRCIQNIRKQTLANVQLADKERTGELFECENKTKYSVRQALASQTKRTTE